MAEQINPLKKRDLEHLRAAMTVSRKKLSPFRKNRLEAVRQYVGKHYSDNGTALKVPINLIELAVNIYARGLVPRVPQVLVTTFIQRLKPTAALLELALNWLLKQIRFEASLGRAVKDALFSMGVMKVGLETTQQVEVQGVFHDYGQPFADAIDLDDWVHDMRARTFEAVAFAGNMYRLPLDFVKESPEFKNVDKLVATSSDTVNLEEGGSETVANISGKSTIDMDEYRPYVELWDIWLPLENLLITVPVDNEELLLRVEEWTGPEGGPYHLLGFAGVPGQIMPLPPVAMWRDIHTLSNILFRKLGRQAERQKGVLGVQSSAAKDGEAILHADDGDVVTVDSPEAMKEFKFGGVDQVNLAFLIQMMDKFSWLAGNLDALGGLSAMSETLGQDKMMVENASSRIKEMQGRTATFTRYVVEDLGLYLWEDPLIELPLIKRVPGTDIEVPVMFSPEAREGDYFDFALRISPYSMQDQTPGQRLQTIASIFDRFVAPAMGQMAEQGVVLDYEALFKMVAKYADLPELLDILVFEEPRVDSTAPQQAAMAANTNRTYTRVNRPGGTRPGRDMATVQALLGAGLQNAQAGAVAEQRG